MQATHLTQLALLLVETVVIAGLMLALYELRHRLGLAVLYVGLGSFQFLQVVASIGLYVEIAPGVHVSPGSVVLFSADVFVVLLLYAYEHIREARQVIYGLVLSNLVVAGVAWIFDLHVTLGANTDLPRELLARNPRVLLVGTVALFADVMLAVLAFEYLSRRRVPMGVRLFLVLAGTLAVDSVIFVSGAFWGHPRFWDMLAAGIVGKTTTAVIYALALGLYMRLRPPGASQSPSLPFRDLFEYMTLAKRVEDLQRSEERYALAVRGANDGLWDWDLRGVRMHVSERWSELMGMEHEDTVTPEAWFARVYPDDLPALRSAVKFHVDGDVPRIDVEFRVEHAGERRWLACRGLLARDAEGTPQRVAGALVDITEQRRAAAAKDEFVSVVSHELRTPVTAIRGAVTLLKSDKARAKREELLAIAERNSMRLSQLIDDLLDVQRIARGKLEYHFDALEVTAALREAVAVHASYAQRTGTHLALDVTETQLWVEADGGRLAQVMANLLSNATKFSPEGSTVTAGAHRVGTRVRVFVRDQGPGVDPEFRDQLFDKFTQAEAGSTRNISGTGLGLNISQSIIEAHGGEIGYAEAPGGGAEFFFVLPSREAS